MLDEELVARSQMGQKDACATLYAKYTGLIEHSAWKWRLAFKSREEARSIVTLKFIELVHKYDERRGMFFSGWIVHELPNALAAEYRYSRAAKRSTFLVSMDAPVPTQREGMNKTLAELLDDPLALSQVEGVVESIGVYQIAAEFLQQARERDVELFVLTILRDYNATEIHEITGWSIRSIKEHRLHMLKELRAFALKRGFLEIASPTPTRHKTEGAEDMRTKVQNLEKKYGKPIASIIADLKAQRLPVRLIAKKLGVGEATIYRNQKKEA